MSLILTQLNVFASVQAKDTFQREYQYLILFKDKRFNYVDVGNPSAYMSAAALQRRKAMGIKIDSFDHPVSSTYIQNISNEGVKVRYATKWLNGIVIGVKDPETANRQKLKFYVASVHYLGYIDRAYMKGSSGQSFEELQSEMTGSSDGYKLKGKVNDGYGQSYTQNHMVGAVQMHKQGYTGKGVNIAVVDAGFFKADKLSAFKHLYSESRVKMTLDLVDDEADVYDDDDHGLHVLSCMAAKAENQMIGTAPDANYFLFRTEMAATEYLIEELNWIRAVEMADSLGVDIVNSSLGYTTFDDEKMNHNHAQLDGKTTWISRAAEIAASRGMLIVNSGGNDGEDAWKKISFPSDVASVLAIGAVDSDGSHIPFSSCGPTADRRIKPDVCAMGFATTVASSYGTFYPGNGTSYAAPVLTGAIACMYQGGMSLLPESVIQAIKMSGSHSLFPDSCYGYGVPNVYLAKIFTHTAPNFNYKEAGLAFPLDDTLRNTLSVHYFAHHYPFIKYTLTKESRFLGLFKYQKKVDDRKVPVRPDQFNQYQILLNKSIFKGKMMLKIEGVSLNGKEELLSTHRFHSI